jgi:hypothetical protein
MPKTKVGISKRALIQRINRKLRREDEQLRAARGGRDHQNLGDYYVIDYRGNFVTRKDVNIVTLGRELGVLQPWETAELID